MVCITGVSVYLMNRTPRSGGYKSPWAVKKVAKRFANKKHQDFSQRLLTEAEILRTLTHPNIVGYRALTKAVDGTWCLAMEKAENSLLDLIEDRLDQDAGPFQPEQIHRVGLDISSALDYLHCQKLLIHGDIKSANVLIFGNFKTAKLCDFGVALPLDSAGGAVKNGHYYVGTEAWSAPEVIHIEDSFNGNLPISSKADMFSYGLTVWEMLSLCLPHSEQLDSICDDSSASDADEDMTAYHQALGTRPALPDLPSQQDYSTAVIIFIACTETDPSKRPTAAEVIRMWN